MNKIEQVADYRVSLHKNIYNEETINTIMDNIIEEFISNNIEVLGSNPNDNVLGFSVSSVDLALIKECIDNGYNKFFRTLNLEIPEFITIDDLYNLTLLVNVDRCNILLVL